MEWWEKINDWEFAGKNKVNRLKMKAERLTIIYLIYQALIFSTVTGALPGVAGTGYWWVPSIFSATLSVVYFTFLIDAVVMLLRAQYGVDLALMELGLAHMCVKTNPTVQMPFLLDAPPKTPEEVRYREMKRLVVSGVGIVLLVMFAVVMIVGCLVIPPAAAVDGGSVSGGIIF